MISNSHVLPLWEKVSVCVPTTDSFDIYEIIIDLYNKLDLNEEDIVERILDILNETNS